MTAPKRILVPGKLREPRPADAPKVGRPSREELRERQITEILDRHSNGESLLDVCADLGLKTATFRGWCRRDAELNAEWRGAHADFVHALFDKLASVSLYLAKANFGKDDTARVNALKAAQDGLKHITARLNPGTYGDTKGSQSGMTVIFNTSLPIAEGDAPQGMIDGEFSVVLTPPAKELPRG